MLNGFGLENTFCYSPYESGYDPGKGGWDTAGGCSDDTLDSAFEIKPLPDAKLGDRVYILAETRGCFQWYDAEFSQIGRYQVWQLTRDVDSTLLQGRTFYKIPEREKSSLVWTNSTGVTPQMWALIE